MKISRVDNLLGYTFSPFPSIICKIMQNIQLKWLKTSVFNSWRMKNSILWTLPMALMKFWISSWSRSSTDLERAKKSKSWFRFQKIRSILQSAPNDTLSSTSRTYKVYLNIPWQINFYFYISFRHFLYVKQKLYKDLLELALIEKSV